MARVLVTRARADAEATARALAQAGHDAVISPLIEPRATGAALPDGPFDAAIVTSRNALRFVAADRLPILLPLHAVGDRTADTARSAGFADIRSAGGDRRDLLTAILAAHAAPARFLFLAGRDRHADLEEGLRAAGHLVDVVETYEAVAAARLTESAEKSLAEGTIDAVLHYSPRSARLFAQATEMLGEETRARPAHLCLSPEVAAAMPESLAGRTRVAAAPTEEALLALLPRHGNAPVPSEPAPNGNAAVARTTATETGMADQGTRGAASGIPAATIDLKAERVAEAPPSPADAAPQPSAAFEPSSAPPRAGLLPYVATALAGALIAAVAILAPRLQLPGERADPAAGRLDARLVALEQQVRPAVEQAARAAPAATLDASVQRLDEAIAALRRDAAGGASADVAARIEALEAAARKVAATPVAAGDLGERLAKLEAAVASRDPEAARQMADALGARLAGLEAAIAVLKPGADPQALAGLAGRVDALARRADEIAAAARDAGPLLRQGLAPIERQIADLEARFAAALAAARDQAARLAAAEITVKGQGASLVAADLVRRRALAEALVGAFHRGEPYKEALDGLVSLGLGEADAKALALFAPGGAPSSRALARQFAPAAGRIAASGATPKDATVSERIVSSFGNLVRVRPVEATGSDPMAIVARIEAALARDDFAAALAAWRELPEPARAGSGPFGDALAARVAAGKAAATLDSETLRGLAAPKG